VRLYELCRSNGKKQTIKLAINLGNETKHSAVLERPSFNAFSRDLIKYVEAGRYHMIKVHKNEGMKIWEGMDFFSFNIDEYKSRKVSLS